MKGGLLFFLLLGVESSAFWKNNQCSGVIDQFSAQCLSGFDVFIFKLGVFLDFRFGGSFKKREISQVTGEST